MYKNNESTTLKGYKSYTNNRKEKSGGGIEIMIRKNMENRTVIVSEGNQDVEELTIRTETKKRTINIISMYGKIEGRESNEKIKEQFSHIKELIKTIENSGEDYILIGDLNAKIGNKEDGIKGNKEGKNNAGKALLKLEEEVKGVIVNKTRKCNGLWTRVNTQKENEKSVLDYVLTNESIFEDIKEMKIDEEKLYRLTKYKGREIKETDHNTMIIEINDEVIKQKKEKQYRWNTKSKKGWLKYEKDTENNKELDSTWKNDKNIPKEWKDWKRVMYNIFDKTFGKIRLTGKQKQGIDEEVRTMIQDKRDIRKETKITENQTEKEILIKKRQELEQQIKKKIEENEEEKLEEITRKLSDKRNNHDVLWKLKKKTEKKQTCAFIITDKEGNDIREPDNIKRRVTEHYEELYENNPVKEGYEAYEEDVDKFIKYCWENIREEENDLTEIEITETIENLEKNKATGPDGISNDMIQRGGKSLKNSIIRMMKIVYKKEEMPEDWNRAYIKNTYKGKGSKKSMNNYRGLILNSHLPKLFEKILEAKEQEVLQNMSEYQCGARKGKSTREHHLTIRTIKEIAKEDKENVTAVYFDIKKCFDKMVLKEAMKELWIKGIKGKHWRLIYKLNSNNILTPLTDLGKCEPVKVMEMIKQGSVLGSVISALTIDSLTRMMERVEKRWEIGEIKINPLLFQDDIFAVNETKNIQETVNIIETFQNLKKLQFHEEKTKKSILNGKKDENVNINGVNIERVESHKYLGKIIEEKFKGKEELKERIRKAKAATNEAFTLMNRKELNNKRISIGIKLLQTVVIPILTNGCETWTKLTDKEKLEVNQVQTQYLTRLLIIPKTTPRSALLRETNLMKIEHIVNMKKIDYFIDLTSREESKLEVKIKKLIEEKNMTYIKEIEEIREQYNIRIKLEDLSPKEAKKIVRESIRKKNDEEIKEKINKEKKTKINKLQYNYINNMNFEDARTIFMIITDMINVKMNYKGKYKENLKCKRCNEADEDTLHIFNCKEDEDINRTIKEKKSIERLLRNNSLQEVAKVARKAIKRREEEPQPPKSGSTAQLEEELSPLDGGE